MKVPAAQPAVGEEELAEVTRVLLSGQLSQGPEVLAFENEFSALVGDRECAAVNSGTSALHLALLALGVGPGDEVVVPSFSFAATANAVALTGATPVFADIDPVTYCLDPNLIEDVMTARTRVIMPVHLYGHPADMPSIRAIAKSHGVYVVEDAAQAHGASLDGVPCGAWGDAAAFSFYPTKNMTAGEGGMVVCATDEVARRVRLLRNQGMETRYQNEVVGLNNRMSDLHAAIGRVQFRKLAAWNDKRRAIAQRYSAHLVGVVAPSVPDNVVHSFHQYTVRIAADLRDKAVSLLADRGVGTGIYYPTPIHRLPAFNFTQELVETTKASQEVFSLPVHPSLDDEAIDHVIESVNSVTKELS